MLRGLRRFAFRLLYNEMAFTYDVVSRLVSLGQWRCWQRSVIPLLPLPDEGLVLELAHGTGDLQIDLAKAGYRSIALDRSRSMGRLAQRKLTRAGLSTLLLRGEAGRLPIQPDSIAAIVCTFPTAFILQPQTLIEVQRVLKRDAPAVIVLSGVLTSGGLRAGLIRGLYRLTGQAYGDHVDEELLSLFQAPGLSAEVRALPLAGSLVQIVLLTKTAARALGEQDHSLDLAREA